MNISRSVDHKFSQHMKKQLKIAYLMFYLFHFLFSGIEMSFLGKDKLFFCPRLSSNTIKLDCTASICEIIN